MIKRDVSKYLEFFGNTVDLIYKFNEAGDSAYATDLPEKSGIALLHYRNAARVGNDFLNRDLPAHYASMIEYIQHEVDTLVSKIAQINKIPFPVGAEL
ncbi:hypothetical protein KW805_03370 [Candidatus Pacearchaeota archaeon]|nr:hypothetical protein [Candidatus Pacearchaeota archaeon]